MLRRRGVGAVLGTLALAWPSLAGCARDSAFFVQDAMLVELPRHQRLSGDLDLESRSIDGEFNLAGHRVTDESGLVLAVRSWRGFPLLVDSSSYEKLTIFVPPPLVREKAVLDVEKDQGIVAFYSRGRAAFPSTGCLGYPEAGQFSYELVTETEMDLKYDLQFRMLSPGRSEEWCETERHLKGHKVLKRKSLDSLTTWEGLKGQDIYEEANP